MTAAIAIEKVMQWSPDKIQAFVGEWVGAPKANRDLDEWAFYVLRCLPLDRVDVLFTDGELMVAGAGKPHSFDLAKGYPRAILGVAAYCRMRGIPARVAPTGFGRALKQMAEMTPEWRCPECGGSVMRGTNRHESPHFSEGQCVECDGIFSLQECPTGGDDP
ncbi:MAG: hypothetical protein ABEN55_13460 [Bradymonadaceae bacterium]